MGSEIFKAACVQLRSGIDVPANIASASGLIREAAAAGADFIVTPEMTSLLVQRHDLLLEKATSEAHDTALAAFCKLASELNVWLLIGSLPIRLDDIKFANRSFLIDPKGQVQAKYDKIHMFDVDLPGGESYLESAHYAAGDAAVTKALPWGRLGMSICYDVRFPYLFRALAQVGAQFIAIPAAFTRTTGEAHWHVLVRARAIETGCYVLAAAQGGTHEDGRETFGHSLIVDPWGEILAEGGEDPGIIWADIDLAKVTKVRGQIPSLQHDRTFSARLPK